MPFVTCPKCRIESMAPRELVGMDWECPKCGEPIAVIDEPTSAAVRRRKDKSPTSFYVGVACLVLSIAVFLLTLFKIGELNRLKADIEAEKRKPAAAEKPREKEGASQPKADVGDDWTHKELLDHLRSKGLSLEMDYGVHPTGWPTATFIPKGTGGNLIPGPTVGSVLCPDNQKARETAGPYGNGGFAWKRFAFDGRRKEDRELLSKIKAAMP